MRIERYPELSMFIVTQTPEQLYKNIIEVEGIEFSEAMARTSPDAIKSFVARQLIPGIGILKHKHMNDNNEKEIVGSHELKGAELKEFIPFEGFHYGSTLGLLKTLKSMIMCISTCMLNREARVGYFTAKSKEEVINKLASVLDSLTIAENTYEVDKRLYEIRFSNGS